MERTKNNSKMKYAIISDIHGNLSALNAVLNDMEKYLYLILPVRLMKN